MSPAKILVVDDDPDLLHLIGVRLTAAGYAVCLARSGAEALDRLHEELPQLVISDIRMEEMDGHELFARIHAEAPSLPVIMLTAHGTIPDAVAATQRGVFSFLTKPFNGQELLARVQDAVSLSPGGAAGAPADWRQDIHSVSLAMEELLRQAFRVAQDGRGLLIQGPRGAGKRALARAVHRAGPRADRPFVVVDCAATPPEDIATVLFGDGGSGGALEQAAGGTLLLAEAGKLPSACQARLLPVLSRQDPLDRAFGTPAAAGAADVRIIATATAALEDVVDEGRFRSDLYYLLSAAVLSVPALEQRRDDIPGLVAHFLRLAGGGRFMSPETLALLQEADWPGNVRQLRSIVERAASVAVTPVIPASLVRRMLRAEAMQETEGLEEARRIFERQYLIKLLQSTAGNVAQAARVAQRNRTEFYKLLSRHHIDPTAFKG
ncbi:MAG TPA: response regulator [Rhodocyclaceae bacterium]|nr:response regulator [Rhodocyclaceae bacterium]